MPDRLTDMLERYGEVCKRTVAARILGCSVGKIKNMLADGRLALACGGEMVDVRSIAEYIERPVQIDELARQRRMGRKWSV
ncbi:MAG: hypothetical protein IKP10_03500 [Clostridia bacterium]|nr:hypothetical protein [Clostridia bacterium]